jgi:hypothetical protein
MLDHVFYRLPSGAAAQTREIEAAYGSDHRPWLGWVRLDPNRLPLLRTRARNDMPAGA